MKPDISATGHDLVDTIDLHTTKLVSERLADLLHLRDEPILLDAIVDQVKELDVVFISAQGATFGFGEIAASLESATECHIIRLGTGLMLPEALPGRAGTGVSLVDDDSCVIIVRDSSQNSHELLTGTVASRLLSWLDDDGSDREATGHLFHRVADGLQHVRFL